MTDDKINTALKNKMHISSLVMSVQQHQHIFPISLLLRLWWIKVLIFLVVTFIYSTGS